MRPSRDLCLPALQPSIRRFGYVTDSPDKAQALAPPWAHFQARSEPVVRLVADDHSIDPTYITVQNVRKEQELGRVWTRLFHDSSLEDL